MIYVANSANYDKIGKAGMLDVRHVSYTSVQTGWEHKDRFLNANEMLFVSGGSVHLTVNAEHFDICENEFLFLPEYCSISATRKSKAPCSFYSVTFEGTLDLVADKMKIKQQLSGNILFVYELLKKMNVLYNPGRRENPECDSLFLTLLYELCSVREEHSEPGELCVQNILDYIHENINLPLEIDDLCKKFNYSRDYLSKLFRRYNDISIKRYINRVKMNTAKQLLTTSRMSVEQVGNAVGFEDVELFYKFFRYHENMTPSAYRKLYR